ncbi:MAG: futalosine hydrolase [Daejeonella sp.]
MKILLVAATLAEIQPLLDNIGLKNSDVSAEVNLHEIHFVITGVGMVATAFSLGRFLAANSFELAINLGIAGSFDRDLNLGEVVNITADTFAEQGAEDGDSFISIDQLGFGESAFTGKSAQFVKSPLLDNIKEVKAITVNKVHGHELSIMKTLSQVNASVESMEGAAFFYACNQYKLPAIQIRCISNFVERRNREKWNIGLAIKNLNNFAQEFLESLPNN